METRTKEISLVTVLGATASGKTGFAVHLAHRLGGEIIGADSRQVYKGMDIGTGKDLEEYQVEGEKTPYHLIDIVEAGEKYNIFEYQKAFERVYHDIRQRQKMPVLCGGSGLYIESVLKDYKLLRVPTNKALRQEIGGKPMPELVALLKSFGKLHNTTDIVSRKRILRAIEIASYYAEHPDLRSKFPKMNPLVVGIKFDRDSRRRRITERLHQRLENGMVEEVKGLLEKGIPAETLIYYGLEYKFITRYLTGEMPYGEMVEKLNTAIHRFAKRQMTWFRRMERKGQKIYWLDGYAPRHENIERVLKLKQQMETDKTIEQ